MLAIFFLDKVMVQVVHPNSENGVTDASSSSSVGSFCYFRCQYFTESHFPLGTTSVRVLYS